MRIAIGISGLFRSKLCINPVNSVKKIVNRFNADLYCHTWSGLESEVPDIFKKEGMFFTTPEPTINYHPLLDPDATTNPKHLYYRKNEVNKEQNKFANKQIIGYSNLYDKIPKKYDIYIRTRWDVMINPKFNFEKFYSLLTQGPVGFMIRESGPNYFPFRKKEGRIVPKVKSKTKNNDWHDMLSDYLIMHKEEHIDTKKIYDLHDKKQLLGSEFGWWQVLSKSSGGDGHTSVYGGVILVRRKRKIMLDENFKLRRVFVN